jgi:hypothetical protein
METPPCSSVRRVGWFPGGACADTPSGGVCPAGVFSAWCPSSKVWGLFPQAVGPGAPQAAEFSLLPVWLLV